MKLATTCLALIGALGGMMPAAAQTDNNVLDEIVWVVGDEAILKSDVENQRMRMLYQGEKIEGDPYCVIPEQLAIQKLFLNQAELDSISVSDDQVEQQVDAQLNMYISQIGSKEKLEEYMGKSVADIRQEWRTNIRNQNLVSQVRRKLTEDISVTPAEVRRYFQGLSADSVPYVPTQVEVQIITFQPKVDQNTVDEIKARLRDYTQRITSGQSQFSTLAILYSEDPGSAAQGGELGFQSRSSYVPEFANVAFQLTDPKKVSKIVETEFGYHIIQLIERRGDRANFRHILLTPKVSDKALNEARLAMDTLRNELDSAKVTFEEAARYLSHDKDTRNSGGLMKSETNGSRLQMDELPAEVARQVNTMKVGEISQPFTMKDRTGRDKVAIVRLKARYDGHKANFYDDYQVIKSLYEEHCEEQILDDFIRRKQRETYVRIKEGWNQCEFKYPGWVK
jgi:peptidyl-prolyl cis-trans isomerase SurA